MNDEFIDKKIVAVLSTTILPKDGMYVIFTLDTSTDKMPDLEGVLHYIGHPDTKNIVEKLGAVPSETKLFKGLEEGEIAVCFSIKQDRNTRMTEGNVKPHQEVTMDDLDVRMILKVDVTGLISQNPLERYWH